MTNNSTKEDLWLSETQLAAIVAPKTREVLTAFRTHGPAAVDDIQRLLNCPSKTIYYQVGKLVKVGLLVESGSSKGTRRDRQVYDSVGGRLRMPEGFQGQRYEQLAAKAVTARLRSVSRTFTQTATRAVAQPDLVSDLFSDTTTFRLHAVEVLALKTAILDLFASFAGKGSPDGRAITVTCVMTPHESRLAGPGPK